jgi:Zn-dependent peptidase ImmA (M78 family)/DNA-binding XRE family transcriptional regulator
MFNPKRLTLARRRRRLTKILLAEAINVTPHTILRYESGDVLPPDDNIGRLARALSFPLEFFFDPDIDELSEETASFRSLSAMTAKERDAALAAASFAFLFSDWVEQKFYLPESDLIHLGVDEPEAAARSLRQKWLLGEKPIKNMVHLLEAKGVRVFSLSENTKTVDAFSAWRGIKPYIFLNTEKTSEHSRFDAAHELGHLILHKHGGPKGRKAEEDADRFAASFLMPSSDVKAILPRVTALNQIIQAKKRWGVSVAALNYRLHKLGITSDWQYRTFCIQLTQHGFREKEPYGIKREQSIAWRKVFTELWKERVTRKDVARSLNLPFEEVSNLLYGLEDQPESADNPRGAGLRLIRG